MASSLPTFLTFFFAHFTYSFPLLTWYYSTPLQFVLLRYIKKVLKKTTAKHHDHQTTYDSMQILDHVLLKYLGLPSVYIEQTHKKSGKNRNTFQNRKNFKSLHPPLRVH